MVLLFLSGIGTGELLVILAVALILLGPKRFPEAAKKVGRVVRDFRRVSNDLQRQFDAEVKSMDVEVEVKEPSIPASYQSTAPGDKRPSVDADGGAAPPDGAPRALPAEGAAADELGEGYTAEMDVEELVETEVSRGSPVKDDAPGLSAAAPTVSATVTDPPAPEVDAEAPRRAPGKDDA